MLGHDLSRFCKGNAVLHRHFAGILGADEVKRIKRQVLRRAKTPTIFYLANTKRTDQVGKHWYVIVKAEDRELQIFDPLGQLYTSNTFLIA